MGGGELVGASPSFFSRLDSAIRIIQVNAAVNAWDLTGIRILPKAVVTSVVATPIVLSNPMIPRPTLKDRVCQNIIKPI